MSAPDTKLADVSSVTLSSMMAEGTAARAKQECCAETRHDLEKSLAQQHAGHEACNGLPSIGYRDFVPLSHLVDQRGKFCRASRIPASFIFALCYK